MGRGIRSIVGLVFQHQEYSMVFCLKSLLSSSYRRQGSKIANDVMGRVYHQEPSSGIVVVSAVGVPMEAY